MRTLQFTEDDIQTLLEALEIADLTMTKVHREMNDLNVIDSLKGNSSPIWKKACDFADLRSEIRSGGRDV
jgi:hypothetical protein